MMCPNSNYQDCLSYKANTEDELIVARDKAKLDILSKNPSAKYIRFWEDSKSNIGRIDVSQKPIGLAQIEGHKMWLEDINNQKVVS